MLSSSTGSGAFGRGGIGHGGGFDSGGHDILKFDVLMTRKWLEKKRELPRSEVLLGARVGVEETG
jgi:hypothetical protein